MCEERKKADKDDSEEAKETKRSEEKKESKFEKKVINDKVVEVEKGSVELSADKPKK
jgi:hypothetical protein